MKMDQEALGSRLKLLGSGTLDPNSILYNKLMKEVDDINARQPGLLTSAYQNMDPGSSTIRTFSNPLGKK